MKNKKSKKELWIHVNIAYEPNKKLAYAYNRCMENTNAEWVLFLDQDLFICTPRWYDMCLEAIKQVGHDAGWITARTNRINPISQKVELENDSNDVLDHIQIAKDLYHKHGNEIIQVKGNLSGFFILTNKTVWKKIGGFRDVGKGMSGIDWDYSKRIRKAGYEQYVIQGLYFYHLYKYKWSTVFKGF